MIRKLNVVVILVLIAWGNYAKARVFAPITSTEAPNFDNFSAEQLAEYERLFLTPGVDSDGDGFTDLQELLARTDKNNPTDTPERINLALSLQPDPTLDSDQDGVPDQVEHAFATDAWDADSTPSGQLTFVPTLAPTLETQFHKDIASLARELDYDPVKIYRFVYNEIRFDEYDGSAKGAATTLHTRLGNEWDQAALLVTLLRMSGIPARFGTGGHWTYFFLSKDNFISPRTVVFVQAWVPPGAEEGQPRQSIEESRTWAPLAPSLKQTRVLSQGLDLFPQAIDGTTTNPMDLLQFIENYLLGAPDVSEVDAFLAHSQLTPVDFFESWLQRFLTTASCDGDNATMHRCLLGRTPALSDIPYREEIVPFEGRTLPLSLPIGPISATDDAEIFDQIPEDERTFVHLRLEVVDNNVIRYVHYPVTAEDTTLLHDRVRDLHGQYNSAPKSVADGRLHINEGSPHTAIEISPDCVCSANDCSSGEACTRDFLHVGSEQRSVVLALQIDALNSGEDATIYKEGDDKNGLHLFVRAVSEQEFDLTLRVATSQPYLLSPQPIHQTETKTRLPVRSVHRVGAVFDRGELILYVDRVEKARATHPVPFYNPPYGGTSLAAPLGEGTNGRLQAGFLDEISIYHGAINPSVLSPVFNEKIYTSQVAERRLVLDPGQGNDASDGRADVVLRMDGIPVAEPFRHLSLTQDSIQATHTVKGKAPDQRPPISAGAIVTISYSLRGGSMARAARLAEELADIPYAVGVSANDEPLLGRFGALLTETFHYRQVETANRVDDLLHLRTQHNITTMMVWTYPDTISASADPTQQGLGAAFLFHPAWFVDAQSSFSGMRKIHFPLAETLEELPWPIYPNLPLLIDGLRNFRHFLLDGTLSFYEGAIIEQWVGTPALSTVLGMFHAKEVVRLVHSDVSSEENIAAVAQKLEQLGIGTINNIINYLLANPKGFVLAPTAPPQRVDPENPTDVLLEVPLYAAISPNVTLWAGNGGFNFGAGQSTTDETVTTVFERDVDDLNSFDGSWEDAVLENGDVLYLPDDTLANVHPAGDPVNLVTGEFYTEEIPDLVFKAHGELDFSITRGYRSQAQYPGPFGYGWTWNHAESLWFDKIGNKRHVHYYDAHRRDHYLEDLGGSYRLPAGATFTFQPVGATGAEPTGYRIKHKDGSVTSFDAAGRLQTKSDRFGNILKFSWDLVHERLTRIEDQLGRGLDFAYDGTGKKVSKVVCDFAPAEQCTTEYRYDPVHGQDLIEFINADGHSTRFEYLSDQDHPLNDHNLTKYILPNGEYLEISYAKNDRVLSHTNSQGKTFKFRYSPLQHWSETWDEAVEWGREGHHETIFYDSNRNVIRHDIADGTVKAMTYDEDHNLTTETDGLGNTTTYSYDDKRNLLTKTNAMGEQWQWRYEDPLHPNFATYIEDPEGGVVEKHHEDGLLIREVIHLTKNNAAVPLERISFEEKPGILLPGSLVLQEQIAKTTVTAIPRLVVDYEYENNQFGNLRFKTSRLMGYVAETSGLIELAGLTNRDTSIVEHRYDSSGLLRTMTLDANQFVTKFAYDALGRRNKVIDPGGHIIETDYNNLHKVVERRSSFLGVLETHHYDSLNRVFRSTDAEGAITQLTYHPARDIVHQAQVAQRVDSLGHTESYVYDPVGNVVSITNANGDSKSFVYDSMRRIVSETDFAGYATRHEYDGVGNRIVSTDTLGRTSSHAYDKVKRRISTTDALGRKTTFQYDKNGNLVELIDVLGTKTTMQRDALGREVNKTVGANLDNPRISRTVFDGLGRVLYEVDPLGTEHHFAYDPGGRVTEERWVDTNGSTVRKRVFEYDSRGLVVKKIDGRGSEHFMRYDPAGRLIGKSDPDPDRPGETIRQNYVLDKVGRITYLENGEGFGTTTVYSSRGEIVSVEDANGYTATFSYDGNGNIIQQTDQLGNATQYVYDAENRLVTTIPFTGGNSKHYYDVVGNHIGSESATGRVVETTVDALDRVVTKYDEIRNESTIQYLDDVSTHTTQVITTNRRGHSTTQTFNGFGDLVAATAPEGLSVQYKHNGLGKVTEIHTENAIGTTVIRYSYDALGRQTIFQDHDGTQRTTVWDPEGNIATEILRDNQIIEHQYDSLDRLRKITVAKNSQEQAKLEQEFEYDRRSLLTRAVDYNGGNIAHELLLDYDAAGRAIVETQDGVSIRRTLNGLGEPVWVEQPELHYSVVRDHAARFAEYSYKQMALLTVTKHPPTYRVAMWTVGKINRTVDLDGRLESHVSMSFGYRPQEVFSRTITYGDRGELTMQDYTLQGKPAFRDSITDVDEELNVRERVQFVAKSFRYSELVETKQDTFSYDGQNRVKTMLSEQREVNLAWDYDPLGNWISTSDDGVSTTRSVNEDNEYSAIGSFQPVYDARGNTIRAHSDRHFRYDWANRLIAVVDDTTGQVIASYSYDALGRRRQKIAGDEITNYYSNDDKVVYVDGPNAYTVGYIDGIPAFMGDFSHCERSADEQCTPRKNYFVTDHTGSVVGNFRSSVYSAPTTLSYDAYGNVLSVEYSSGETVLRDNQMGFGGALWDVHARVWHFPFRDYDPTLGRFLQRDPLGFIDGLNMYPYSRNNPINRVDPLGLASRSTQDLFNIDLEQTNQILAEQAGVSDRFAQPLEPVQEAIEDVASLVAQQPVAVEDVLQDTAELIAGATKATPRDVLRAMNVEADFLKLNVDVGGKIPVGNSQIEGFVSVGLDGADIEAKVFTPGKTTKFGAGLKAEVGIWGDGAGQFYLGPYGKHENGAAKTSFELKDLGDQAAPIVKQELKDFTIGKGVVKIKVGLDLSKTPGADQVRHLVLGVWEFFTGEPMRYNEKRLRFEVANSIFNGDPLR